MFPSLRRRDRQMEIQEAEKILHLGEYGVLSMISSQGFGYGIPLSYVYSNGAIYFHCAPEGYKLDILKEHNQVSFCVVAESFTLPEKFSVRYQSVVAFGEAQEVFNEEKNRAFQALLAKYAPDFLADGQDYIKRDGHLTKVIKVQIKSVTGKENN